MGGLIYIPWEQHPVSHTLATCGSSPPLCVQIWGVSPMRLFREGGEKMAGGRGTASSSLPRRGELGYP